MSVIAVVAMLAGATGAWAQPANDDFAAAEALAGPNDAAGADTTAADREVGEPNPLCSFAGETVGHTVWYTFTPSISGAAAVTTVGSDFDTTVAIYRQTGSGFAGLTSVGCSDDIDPITFTVRQSIAVAPVTAGATYYVQVGGWGSAFGNLALTFAGV